jgi:hypothetical protein
MTHDRDIAKATTSTVKVARAEMSEVTPTVYKYQCEPTTSLIALPPSPQGKVEPLNFLAHTRLATG